MARRRGDGTGAALTTTDTLRLQRVTEVIGFDDLSSSGGNPIFGDYAGPFTWAGWWTIGVDQVAATYGTDNGFVRGVTSGTRIAYVGNGGDATLQSVAGNFDLASMEMTAAWRDGLKVTIVGLDDGVEEYRKVLRLDDDGPTLVRLGFADVDTVTITTAGGRNDTPEGDGTAVVIDDVKITETLGAITGIVFDDANSDGVRDPGEEGLKGRLVFVDANHSGLLDAGELSARTNAAGAYTINGVVGGDYDLVEAPPRGWHATDIFETVDGYTASETRYSFTDISAVGRQLTFADRDDGSTMVHLSTALPFYGQARADLWVAVNGFIGFQEAADGTAVNRPLPDGFPVAIAPLWDDLNISPTGAVYLFDDPAHQRVIVEWKNMGHFGDDTKQTSTFEAILGDDGTIRFAYKSIADAVTATVGVQSGDGLHATQVSYNTPVAAHSAELFEPYVAEIGRTTVHVDFGHITSGFDLGQAPSEFAGPMHGGEWAPPALSPLVHLA